jgi:HK97 family phage major capsid protein
MNEEELKALIAKIEKATGETMDSKLKDAFKELDPQVLKQLNEDSKELNKSVDALVKDKETLEATVKTMGEEMTKLKEVGSKTEGLSFAKQVSKIFNDNKDSLSAMKNGDSKTSIRMTIKAVGDMTTGTNVTGQIPQAEREAGITRIVRRQPYILELVSVGRISSTLWEWVQQTGAEGSPAMTAEGAAKAQIDFDLVLASAPVRKVTAYVKISKEMLDDIPLMEAEVNEELRERINLTIDDQLLSGDGLGQNLTGILENAIAFTPGSFATGSANEVPTPNNADVLRVAINQIMIAQFQPNWIVMNPTDVAAMDLDKGTDGHYILKPFSTLDNSSIKGVPIISNTGITEGDYLVGDFTKAAVRFKEGLTIDVGFENDDFTKNFVTILAEARLVQRVKSNHYPAFVTGDFATDKAAIAKA